MKDLLDDIDRLLPLLGRDHPFYHKVVMIRMEIDRHTVNYERLMIANKIVKGLLELYDNR